MPSPPLTLIVVGLALDQVAFKPFSPLTNELPRNTNDETIVESLQQFCKPLPPIITELQTSDPGAYPILLSLLAIMTL
jgi:hypothetical protein